VPGSHYPRDGSLPFSAVRQVEDQQTVLRGCSASGMAMGLRKLEMIGGSFLAEHHPIETIMVTETMEDVQPQPIAIEADQRIQIVSCAGNSELRNVNHAGSVLKFCKAASRVGDAD